MRFGFHFVFFQNLVQFFGQKIRKCTRALREKAIFCTKRTIFVAFCLLFHFVLLFLRTEPIVILAFRLKIGARFFVF